MILLDRLGKGMGRLVRGSLKQAKEITDGSSQTRLVVLDRQDVVGFLVADRLGDGGLGAQRIDGDDAALQRQGGQEFGNRRLLVRFLRRRALPQHQPRPSHQGADQMQGRGIDLLRSPTGLAVDGHHTSRAQGWQ